tara:strand:- start:36 stop:776 length:741 start_codon:yes stop_codon:yes gene_type:complete
MGAPTAKKPRKKKSKMYFGKPCQDAIIRYNNTNDTHIKSRIYEEHIDKPFNKLAENIIHTFKFYYFDVPLDEVKNEVVAFMVMQLAKYNPDKGKAFSYFSIVAKNWLILHNTNNYKKMKSHTTVDVLDYGRNLKTETEEHENKEMFGELVDQMLKFWENNLHNYFKRKKDLDIAFAVLELFRKRQFIENFNKKALYIMIREMTGANTQLITRIVNQMKSQYKMMFEQYMNEGQIETWDTGSIFGQT